MHNITPKEAIANLNHLYGVVSPDIQRSLDLAIKALERPTGDCISREALKEEVRKHAEYYADRTKEDRYNVGYTECACEILDFIDNAPTVPQVTVFTESTDEKAIEDMKAELQSVIEPRPKGVWTTDEKGYFYCDQCGKYPHDQYATTDFCPNCGTDMRKGDAE